jgi:hypothetical protein
LQTFAQATIEQAEEEIEKKSMTNLSFNVNLPQGAA